MRVQIGAMQEFTVNANDSVSVELLAADHTPGLYRVCVSLAVTVPGPGYAQAEASWDDARIGPTSAFAGSNTGLEESGAPPVESPGGVIHSSGSQAIGLTVHVVADNNVPSIRVSASATRLA